MAPTSPMNTSQNEHDRSGGHDQSLLSRTGLLNTSEIDLSSPLNYGTPASSRIGSVAAGTPYVIDKLNFLVLFLMVDLHCT